MHHLIEVDLARSRMQNQELSRQQGRNRRSLEILLRARREAHRLNRH
ncbi:MAG TPA: hypothetical protein VFJ12_11235 [Segeticoccus sp.]|jgi:hypothetical protein|nr:hypothetical protein [Segeticoccus sp.]